MLLGAEFEKVLFEKQLVLMSFSVSLVSLSHPPYFNTPTIANWLKVPLVFLSPSLSHWKKSTLQGIL